MSGIRIVSRSENGARAIRKNLEEHKKAGLKDRILFRQAFRMEVKEDPLSLEIIGKHRYLTASLIEPVAVDMMSQNGAFPDDYYIEEVE